MSKAAVAVAAAGVALLLYKGKDIRALVTMTGEGWDNLHPDAKQRAALVLADANKEFKKDGVTVGAFEGWRSEQRQRAVINAGNSTLTDVNSSYHRWGLAIDFVFIDRFGWTWEPSREMWNRLGAIIKKHGFEWGGDWSFFDGPHAQLPVERVTLLKQKYLSPEEYIGTFA